MPSTEMPDAGLVLATLPHRRLETLTEAGAGVGA